MKNYFKFIVFVALVITSFSSKARLALKEESPVIYRSISYDINVKPNGSYESFVKKRILIQNEQGRDEFGSITLYFSKDIAEIEIKKASVVNNGEEQNIDKSKIEIKPLASSEKGFDQKYQVLISFPNLVVGSEIILEYLEKIHTPVIDKNYSTYFSVGEFYTENMSGKITSKIKNLEFLKNDPTDSLEISKILKDGHEIIEFKTTKPVYNAAINEPYSNVEFSPLKSYIHVSSHKNYSEIGNYFAPAYFKVINEELSSALKIISDKAGDIKDENEKIEFVISEVNQIIRYMGSWQSIKGKFFPRTIAEIQSSGYADCKEFSSLVSAILSRNGFKVNPAFVVRGRIYHENKKLLPDLNFNHAILLAESKSGKKYWLDPTNFVSMSRDIFPDISARNALVIDHENSRLEKIPAISLERSKIIEKKIISYSNSFLKFDSNFSLIGPKAINLTGMELTTSKKAIEEMIFKYFSGEINFSDEKLEIPDLTSRIVKDIDIKFSYKIGENLLKTNLGNGFPLTSMNAEWMEIFLNYSSENINSAFLSEPCTYKNVIILKDFSAKNLSSLNVDIENKWFRVRRALKKEGNDVVIDEELKLKETFITPLDYNDKEFKGIQSDIKQKIQKAAIIGDFSN